MFSREANKKAFTNLCLILGVFLLVSSVGYFISTWEDFDYGNDLIVYPVQCDDWFEGITVSENFENCLQPRALSRISFNINASSKEVIVWYMDDENDYAFSQKTNCIIVSSQNWSCDHGNISSFGFNQGKFFKNDFYNVIFVSKSEWDSVNDGKPSPL